LPILNIGIETDGDAAPHAIIEPQASADIIPYRKRHLRQQRWSPRAQIRRRNGEAKSVIESLVNVRPPEKRHVADVKRDILENDILIFVNTDGARAHVKVRLRRIVRRK